MSFADELRKNHQSGNAPSEDVKYAGYLTSWILSAVRSECQRISSHSRSLEGYYKRDYEEHSIVRADAYPTMYFYKEQLGNYSITTLERFNVSYNHFLSTACRNLVIENTRRELVKMGFSSVTVRAEELTAPLVVGKTKFLNRGKCAQFPAFRIYVKVSW